MLGVDRYAPFSPDDFRRLKRRWGRKLWVLAYIGGPRYHGPWTPADAAALDPLTRGGTPWLPTYVGFNAPWDGAGDLTRAQGAEHGNETLALLQAWGFSGLACLDVEHATSAQLPEETMAYLQGWADALRAGSCTPAVYGSIGLCERIAALPGNDIWTFAARYLVTGRAPRPAEIPNVQLEAFDAWQFANGVPLASGAYDLTTAKAELNTVFARLHTG